MGMLLMNTIRRFMLAASLLAMLCAGITAYGQKVWEKKPYQQWSFRDVWDVLDDSPWSETKQNNEDSHGSRGLVNVRLHSALPIRQALVRRRQIIRDYDQWTAADKAIFDSQVRDFLKCPGCAKYYILTYHIFPRDSSEARRKLKNLTLDDLKPYVFLINDKGERRRLANFMPPETVNKNSLVFEQAVFFFERVDEQGKPFLSLDNKKFYFQIGEKAPHLKFLLVKKFTFEVRKLVHHGEIIF